MICYRCGCTLSEKDFCTGCGAEVGMYKRILSLSNRYYNDALEKAQVRDLSGAELSLKQSIKLNKNNVDARNLLGLIYYETGEVVEAFGQWVISKNIRDTKNIAADYIDMMQANPSRFDAMNQNLRKYNQSLVLCYQDSLDYAKIQLKKILSVAPKYLRAHQLLALIYIKDEEWDKAERELDKCAAIDAGNTTTLRYMHEVQLMLTPVEGTHNKEKRKGGKDDVRVYQSGNETIIQPVNRSESRAASILLNLGIGIVIGIAITFFLILPGRIQSAKAAVNEELRTISEASDAKTATIDELELQINKLQSENDKLNEDIALGPDEGSVRNSDALMEAMNAYLTNPEDITSIAKALEGAESDEEVQRSDAYIALYDRLMQGVGPQLATYYFDLGYSNYKNDNFEDAIPDFERSLKYESDNSEALFCLGNSYRNIADEDKAKEIYAEVIDKYPETERASKAETYLAEMNN